MKLKTRGESAKPEPPAALETSAFTHTPDYRSILFWGMQYSLTSRQAQVVEMLDDAHLNGTRELSQEYILAKLGTVGGRLRDTFRSTGLWGKLIVVGGKRGMVRLNLPA